MFASVHNSQLSWFMFPVSEPRAVAVVAPSQPWQGQSIYIFPQFPFLYKVCLNLQATQSCEVFPIAPWWPSEQWFPHVIQLGVDPPGFLLYCQGWPSQSGHILDVKSFSLHVWRLSCSTSKQQGFQNRSLDSLHANSVCVTKDGFALLAVLHNKELIQLVPQPLK